MKKSNSQVKENNQSNFSSVPTVTYCSSPKSAFRNKSLINNERLISEPKYSNENIFAKNNRKNIANIFQSVNVKARNHVNSGIYITGLENESNMYTDIQKSIITTNDNSNISKSVTNKNKKYLNNKLSIDTLPYISNINQNEDLIPISPLFSCCNQENSPKLLNKILYRQKLQEIKENSPKTSVKEKKRINTQPKKITVKDGPKNYISKTRELNRLKYYMNLKLETIKDFYYDYRQELKNINFTINTIKAYKHNLENKFINEYVSQLRTLNKITLNERLKEEQQRNEIVNLKKNISNMSYVKKRLELNKFLIEKWIGLQIYIKDKVRIDDKQIKNYLNKNYKGKLLFQSVDEFDDVFKKKEINNLRLIKTLNIKTEEKAVLFRNLKELQKANTEDDNYLIKMISEKKNILTLLKLRNEELLQEKKEALKMKDQPSLEESQQIINDNKFQNFKKEKDKKEKKKINKNINYNIIYSMIKQTFDYIISNDRQAVTESNESIQYINILNDISSQALAQMKIIEKTYIFLVYYKMNNTKGNEEIYKQVMEEIEQAHKFVKSEKFKKEEELKLLQMHKKMEEKKNRVVFKPTRQDIYSSLIYIEKIKNKEKKMKKNTKRKIDIFDFLYDIDDDKINFN